MALDSMQEIFDAVATQGDSFWRVVQKVDMRERQVSEEESFEKMRTTWKVMLDRKSTRLNSSHKSLSRMPSSA